MVEFCTISDKTYGNRVEALYRSMEKWCGDFILRLLALDQETWLRFGARTHFNRMVVVKYDQFITQELHALRAKRKWCEFVWTLKPWWIKHCFHFGSGEQVLYLDGDMCFFAPLKTLMDELQHHQIAITPHRFSKSFKRYLVNGRFNGAFVWMMKTQHSLDCVTEWANQCSEWCFLRYDGDKFVDQKYLNAWPEKWGAHSVVHKGVNLAPWNQGEGHYTYEFKDGILYVDGYPVVLYHFHEGLNTNYPICPAVQKHIYRVWEATLGAIK